MLYTKNALLNWGKDEIENRNRQYRRLEKSRNKQHRLMYKRVGPGYQPWCFAIESPDEARLRGLGEQWYRLGFISEWKIKWVP